VITTTPRKLTRSYLYLS